MRVSLRRRVLLAVLAFIAVSLVGSIYSLVRILEVKRSLDAINKMEVPISKTLGQLQSDSEILRKEIDRKLGLVNWSDPTFKPQTIPRWMFEQLEKELDVLAVTLEISSHFETRPDFTDWLGDVRHGLSRIQSQVSDLFFFLEQKDFTQASKTFALLGVLTDAWQKKVHWAVTESERSLRLRFMTAQHEVTGLKTAFQLILITIFSLSLMLLWIGERALRPLADLTELVRHIATRGLKPEDRRLVPEIPISRTDEVGELAREFKGMATTIIEREITLEHQSRRMIEQNRMLQELSVFNENILKSIESVLIVFHPEGTVRQLNNAACRFLGRSSSEAILSPLASLEALAPFRSELERALQNLETLEPVALSKRQTGTKSRLWSGTVLPLRDSESRAVGIIMVLDDVTESTDLAEKLKAAEHLAGMGRMSAQVAHEVRNPLHSIGLEAELALDRGEALKDPLVKRASLSILEAVDRLSRITENYLKLSRPDQALREACDLGSVVETVLASYALSLEKLRVRVDWSRAPGVSLVIDADPGLLEQALGNLVKNSIWALENKAADDRKIEITLGAVESGRVWLRFHDNGPGVAREMIDRLFTPFVTTRAEGTGLGLSFAKRVLDAIDAEIHYRTEEKGACFDLLFLPSATSVHTDSSKKESVLGII